MAAKAVPSRPLPRLYLATPVVDDPSPLTSALPGLLAGVDVAAVLARLKPTDQRTMISRIKALAPAIQDKGASLVDVSIGVADAAYAFEMASREATLVGGALGVAMGAGAAALIDLVSPMPASIDPKVVLGGVLGSCILGAVFGLWPALSAAFLPPIEALRHE